MITSISPINYNLKYTGDNITLIINCNSASWVTKKCT